MPAGSVRTVQHLEGGIIAEIYVDEGQVVDAGSPLVRFEGATADAELEQIRAREVALKLKAERLRAFVLGYDPDFSLGNERPDLVADQRVILEVQNQARASQQAVLLSRIEQREAELANLRGQAKNLQVQAEIIREQVEMRRELVDRGLVSRVVYLETERAYTQALGDLASVQGEIQRTREALNEARNSLTELDASLGNDALDEIGALNAELAQVAEKKRELEDRSARLLVEAPVRGIVKGLVTRTIGSVAGPGELLMEIVPMEDTMVAEVRIDPGDIGHLRVGQDAEVKVTTYDVARLGAIKGRLERISASTFQNERGEYYYKGRISLAQNHVGSDPSRNLVLPGMVVDADINTGTKSLLRYLLKPVFRSVDVAFSER
jgi:adhesin transport system membrane fusion protein